MRIIKILFLMFGLTNALFGQVINGVEYWDLSDTLREKVNNYYTNERDLILMDSVLIKEISHFYYSDDSVMLNKRHTPFTFAMRNIISDSLNSVGIFSFRVNNFHSPTYIMLIEGKKREILLPRKKYYQYYKFVKFVSSFVKKHENEFSLEDRVMVWKKVSELMDEYNFLYNPRSR